MASDTKPFLHINIDNIKVEEYYRGLEVTDDTSITSNVKTPNLFTEDVKEEKNDEQYNLATNVKDEFSYDSADSSDSNDTQEFMVYPSVIEDFTLTTGMNIIIEKLLRNKELLKNVNLEDEHKIAKVEESETNAEVDFEESSNMMHNENLYHEDLYGIEEIHTKTPNNLRTSPSKTSHGSLYEQNSNKSINGKREIGTKIKLGEISKSNNSQSYALNNSVTITPLVAKQPVSEKALNQNNSQSFVNVNVSNNKLSSNTKSILNRTHFFPTIGDNFRDQKIHKSSCIKYLDSNVNLETQTMYTGSRVASYQQMTPQNRDRFATNSMERIQQTGTSLYSSPYHCNQYQHGYQTLSPHTENQDFNLPPISMEDIQSTYLQTQDFPYIPVLPPSTNYEVMSDIERKSRNKSDMIIPCLYCPFMTRDFHNWFSHIKVFHKQTMVTCPFCGYLQNKKPNMQTHVYSVHLGYKPYSCHICPFSTGWKNYLKIHLLKHSKLK